MIAITGASGRLGRAVARALLASKTTELMRFGTRNREALEGLANSCNDIEVHFADFDDPASLVALMRGARMALMVCGTAENSRRLVQHRQAIDAAREADVGHLVYVSFVNPNPHSLFPFAVSHAGTEEYLASSGIGYIFVRNNHYFNNLENALRTARRTGILSLPGAHGAVAYAGLSDIAEAISEILRQSKIQQRIWELTGPEALDLFDVARRATRVWGCEVRASDMSAADFRHLLAANGMPAYAIDAQVGIRLACGAGEYSRVSRDVERLLDRPPRRIDTFLQKF